MGGKSYTKLNTFKPWDSNTICDATGFKKKMSEVQEDWQGFFTIPEAWASRQPQDFPVVPMPQQVYSDARSEQVFPDLASCGFPLTQYGFNYVYQFNNTSGPVVDETGTSDGTVITGADNEVQRVEGLVKFAAGASDSDVSVINFGDFGGAIENTGALSFVCRVLISDIDNSIPITIGNRSDDAVSKGWQVRFGKVSDTSHNILVFTGNVSNPGNTFTTDAFTTNTTDYFVFGFNRMVNGSNLDWTIYLDNAVFATGSLPIPSAPTSDEVYIGASGVVGGAYNTADDCLYTDMAFSSVAVSDSQMIDAMKALECRYNPNFGQEFI